MKRSFLFYLTQILTVCAFAGNLAQAEEKKVEKTIIVQESESDGAFFGVFPADLNDDIRQEIGFKGDGVYISDTVDDGPAEEAGIEEDDVILKLDGKAVKNQADFRAILKSHKPGDKVEALVWRKGEEKTYTVELAERPTGLAENIILNLPGMKWETETYTFLGVETRTISGDIAKDYFNVKAGALIEEIVENAPAKKAGMKSGDVIVKIGGIEVTSKESLSQAVRKHNPGDKVKVEYYRKSKPASVEVVLAEKEAKKMITVGDDFKEFHFDQDCKILSPEFDEALQKYLRNVKIKIKDSNAELRKEIEDLKADFKKLKEELKAKTEDLKAKKEEQKADKPPEKTKSE